MGLSIKNFPKEITKDQVFSFLKDHGFPKDANDNLINVGDYGNVTIEPIDNDISTIILNEIDFNLTKSKFFGRPIYCKLMTCCSPIKVMNEKEDNG